MTALKNLITFAPVMVAHPVTKQEYEHGFRTSFPTFGVCMACSGIDRAYSMGGSIDDRELAFQAALVQHGYMIAKWEPNNVLNREFFPKKCTCTCEHDWTHESPQMFEHRYECAKCGIKRVVDSSD